MTRQEKTIVNTSSFPTSAGTQEVGEELRDEAEQETAGEGESKARERGVSMSMCMCVYECVNRIYYRCEKCCKSVHSTKDE